MYLQRLGAPMNRRERNEVKRGKGDMGGKPLGSPGMEDRKKENCHVHIDSPIRIEAMDALLKLHREERGEDTRDKNKQLLWTQIAAVTVFLYTLAAFWQGGSSQSAANAAKSAAETAARELVLSERPWLQTEWEPGQLHLIKDVAFFEAKAEATNVGHSVAQHTKNYFHLVRDGKMTGHECDVSSEEMQEAELRQGGSTVFPNGSGIFEGNFEQIPLKDVEEGKIFQLYMVGCTVYGSSIDKVIHHTQRIYILSSKLGNFTKNSGTLDVTLTLPGWGTVAD